MSASAGTAENARGNAEKVAANILLLGGGELISRLIAFVGTAYLARILEPAGFGVIGFAAALFGYFQLAVTAGFHDVGAREVARRPRDASSIAAGVILFRLALATVALAGLAVVAWRLDKPATIKLFLVLMGLSFFSLALDTSWVYKGLERNRLPGAALIFGQALYVGAILFFVHSPADVTRVPLAQFFGEAGGAMLLAIPLFLHSRINLRLREGWRIFRASWSLAATKFLRTLIFTFDVALLGFLIGEKQVGLYTAPYRICFLVLSLATVIQVSYLPAVTRAAAQDVNQVGQITGRAIYLATVVAAPLVVGGGIASAPLLETLFGASYLEGATAFQLLLLSIGCAFIYGAIHNVLLAYDRMKVELAIMAVSAGLNVALNFLAIPRYGLVGAAAVTAISETVTVLLGLMAIYRLKVPLKLAPVWRPLLAASVMGVVLAAIGQDRKLILYLSAGAIVYLVVLTLLRGVPDEARRTKRS